MSLKSHEIIILTFFELQSAERNIRNQIEKRDSWIREYKQITESNPDMAAYLYFGIPDNRGRSDVRYKSIVENIKIANDDAIFFGEQLHSLLAKRGKLIKKKYGNRHWRVTEATWKKAFKILFPSSVSYQGYVEMTSKIKDNELIF